MKVIVSTPDLNDAVSKIAPATADKSPTPILSCIRFRAGGNALTLDGTDFSIAVTAKIPAEVNISGSCAANAKDLAAIVNNLPGDIATLELANDTLVIKSDATRFELFTAKDVDEFPEFAFDSPTNSFQLNTAAVKKLIDRTAWACAPKDDGRPAFQGVCLNFNGDSLTALATNTHRIARAGFQLADSPIEKASVIIPQSALAVVQKALPQRIELVDIAFNERAVKFAFNNIVIFSRLIDSFFPDTEKLFENDFTTQISTNKAELLKAAMRVKLISKKTDYNTVILKFDNEGLELRAESYATGKAVEHLTAEVTGDDIEIAFNIDYILDFVKTADAELIQIKFNGPINPAYFYTENTVLDFFDYVATPIRI